MSGDMLKSNDWKKTAMRSIAAMVMTIVAAAAALIWLHDDPASLVEPINAIFDGIVRVLTLLVGAGGVAYGAYRTGQSTRDSV